MNKKIIINIIVAIIIIFVISVSSWVFVHRKKISNELFRAYWDFKRYGNNVDIFAGCQAKTMMETKTDEEFTIRWEKESKEGHFDAIDVDRHMLKYCPPSTPEKIKNGWDEYFKDKNYSDMDEEEEKQRRIEKSIKMSEYKRKFLNREFTALKDEPREQ